MWHQRGSFPPNVRCQRQRFEATFFGLQSLQHLQHVLVQPRLPHSTPCPLSSSRPRGVRLAGRRPANGSCNCACSPHLTAVESLTQLSKQGNESCIRDGHTFLDGMPVPQISRVLSTECSVPSAWQAPLERLALGGGMCVLCVCVLTQQILSCWHLSRVGGKSPTALPCPSSLSLDFEPSLRPRPPFKTNQTLYCRYQHSKCPPASTHADPVLFYRRPEWSAPR